MKRTFKLTSETITNSYGGKPEYFRAYRQMVLGAMKLVLTKKSDS